MGIAECKVGRIIRHRVVFCGNVYMYTGETKVAVNRRCRDNIFQRVFLCLSCEGVKRVTKTAGQTYTIEYESGKDVRRGIFNALSKANCPILMMRPGGLTLEESFLKLTEGGED